MLLLKKSYVKGHLRTSAKGKVSTVKAHTDSRTKKAKAPAKAQASAKPPVVSKKQANKVLPEPVIVTDKKGDKKVVLTRQTPKKTKASAPKKTGKMKVGAEVMYSPEGSGRIRVGIVLGLKGDKIKIQGRRTSLGEYPIHVVPAKDVMTLVGYKRKQKIDSSRKTDPEVYTSESDRTKANFNLTKEENERRRKLTEKRLGQSEANIVNHPGFKGVAFKISSELAKQNGISTELAPGNEALWHRAVSPDYQEILLAYFGGAMRSWRQEVSKPLTKQVKENISGFKQWLKSDGTDPEKRVTSYIAQTMAIDGKRTAIRYLQERRLRHNRMADQDYSDAEENPETRHTLSAVSTQPQQELYTMQVRGETLENDVKSALRKLSTVESVAVKAKLGMKPFETPPVEIDSNGVAHRSLGLNNTAVAKILTAKGYRDGKLSYTRNSVATLLAGAFNKIKTMPEYNSMKFWADVQLGRELNYRPPHAGRVAAGVTASVDYERDMGFHDNEQGLAKSQGRTIAVDFDGVIADYSQGYKGKDVFGDPLPGAVAGLQALREAGWFVMLFTTRPDTAALRDYLGLHNIPIDAINNNPEQPADSNHGKPLADIYLDDRGMRFHNWEQAMDELTVETMTKSSVLLMAPMMAVPAELHPAGKFTAGEAVYEVRHIDGMAVLNKSCTIGFDGLADLAQIQGLHKSLSDHANDAVDAVDVTMTSKGLAFMLPVGTELEKSFSSDTQKKYPGGRWVTVKQGPLAGRHIYLVPHADGSATVMVGGGPAMRHKVLNAKRDEEKKEEQTPEQKKEQEDKKAEAFEKKPKLSIEEEKQIKTHKKEVKKEINIERQKMADVVRDKVGIETELTDEDREKVDKLIEKRFAPKKKAGEEVSEGEEALERMKELRRIKEEKRAELAKVMEQVKLGLLHDDPSATGIEAKDGETEEETAERMTLSAAVKECAEELAESHYKIKELQKQSRDLSKIMRVGKSFDKFKLGESVAASFAPISQEEIQRTLVDEAAMEAELDAHYKLIRMSKGIAGLDESGKELKGGKELAANIQQGGFEAMTGLVGGITGTSLMTRDVYEALGAGNAAIVARNYLEQAGVDPKDAAKELEEFINENGNPVAFKANERGEHFLKMAEEVRSFGLGSDNLMTINQAMGTSLKYSNKAYEAFGQAEGALNQGAELVYALRNDKKHIEITANSKDALDRKRKALGLKASDVSVRHIPNEGYRMVITPRAFGKLVDEAPTDSRGFGGDVMGFSPAEVKAGHANTDDFRPSAIRSYTPEDKHGQSSQINIKTEQQSTARLVAQQKRVYLNHEAGTGKSFSSLLTKAHIEDVTGQPKKMIIYMPDKLQANFAEEVRKFSNYTPLILPSDSKKKRAALEQAAKDPNIVVITNHQTLENNPAAIMAYGADITVADEAHKITQRETSSKKSSKSANLRKAASASEYYVAMSGTPTPSDLSELYFHANLIKPEKFHSQKEFMKKFGAAHKGVGYKTAIAEFMNTQLNDHVYTVKKTLDTKFTLHRHAVKLSNTQREGYKAISEAFRNKEMNHLQRDRRYNEVLNSQDWKANAKFDEIDNIVQAHIKNKGAGEKIILYAQAYKTVDQIRSYLKEKYPQYDHVEFTGQTKKSELGANKDRLKNDPKVMFSIHTSAGVEGLNLQYDKSGGGATTVVAVASGEYSYAAIDQLFSRAYRTGALKDIDGHLVLTNTPHDIGTELRLDEKEGVANLVQNKRLGIKGPNATQLRVKKEKVNHAA